MSLHTYVHGYAGEGLELFPVDPATKAPLHSQLDATTDLDQLDTWWDRWPDALIGHLPAPGVVLLDIDPRHGGLETWKAVKAELNGGLPTTRAHLSGRGDGGGHVWFERPPGRLTATKLDAWARARGVGVELPGGRWTGGIDLLQRGHRYTILPPSRHPETGEPYCWKRGRGLAVAPAPMPVWLAELVATDDRPAASNGRDGFVRVDTPSAWLTTHRSWADVLGPHGWTLVGGDGEADGSRWRHPEATTAHSATIRDGRLYVFSTSTAFEPTEPDGPHGHDKLDALAVLEHGGDLSAAGRVVRRSMDGAGRPGAVVRWEPTGAPGVDLAIPGDDIDTLAPVDLTDAVDGIGADPPTIMARSDGVCLLYPGRVHWFQGEPESCKSWAAQMVVADEIRAGRDVLYLDYEDDARGVVARLMAMGVTGDAVLRHLFYVRPDEPVVSHGTLAPLLGRPYGLCVLDGVTEAMTIENLSMLDNTDIARWMRLVPKHITRETGAAVVCVDHVTKNRETQGRYAIGGQHKLAGVTGAAYKFELIRPFARAVDEPIEGTVALTVEKDRTGYVRGRAVGGKVATLVLVSRVGGGVGARLDPPGTVAEIDWQIGWKVLRYLTTYPGSSQSAIERAVPHNGPKVRDAVRALVAMGYASAERKGQSHLHTITEQGKRELPD